MLTSIKKNNVAVIVITALIASLYCWRQCRPVDASLQEQQEKPLVIGMMSGWPPFMSVNPQGEYEGYDVEVAKQLAQKLNRPLVIKDLGSVQTVLIALEQGTIDIAMSGFDNTKKRMETFNMVRYTSRESTKTSVVFWQQVPQGIKSLKDCVNADMTICVEPGTSQEKYVDSFIGATKKQVPSISDMIMELRFGKVGALVLEPRVSERICKQVPELVVVQEPLPAEFAIYGEGIALKKQNTDLAKQVQQAVTALSQDGTLAQLEQTWLNEGDAS